MGFGRQTRNLAARNHLGDGMDPDQIKEVAEVALSDGLGSVEDIERLEEMLAHNWEKTKRLIREDEAACSDERVCAGADGAAWTYVIVRNEYVRIMKCATKADTLVIPDEFEGLPVAELAIDACSYLDSVREIICPAHVEKIGQCAFRQCAQLERLVLPRNVDTYDSSWVRNCKNLRELVLPGMLERITPSVFDEGDVRFLTLGIATRDFIPGMFSKGRLERIEIDGENPYITTDGKAIFANEGKSLRALALSCEQYVVPDGCEVIEKKAFANRGELVSVELPDSVTAIEEHAFSYAGIEHFDAPAGLRTIGARAFFRCRDLADVTLNEGLVSIGDDAFTGTGLSRIHAPASLEVLGHHVAADTKVTFSGEDMGFTIEQDGILEIDRNGGLYRNTAQGKRFVRMLDDKAERYEIQASTVEVEPLAFAKHKSIREVVFPEGLLRIGEAAFRECHELAIADFPLTLEEVGDEAFLDSSLERVFIPRNLRRLGDIALITHGAHNGDGAPSLASIEADEANERFYSVPGLLIERHGDEGSHVVVYADGVESVRIPDDVVAIDPYAFGGARHLQELYLSDRIRRVGMRGLSLDCLVRHFHIDLADPLEGHESVDLFFPDSARSAHEIQLAFNLSSSVDLARIFKHYDSAVANMHEFDKRSSGAREDVDIYTQAKLALGRLGEPLLMSSTNKIMLTQVLSKNLKDVCEAIARHDDRKAIDDLIDLEILNKDNLLDIIDHIGKLQDAAMTGYLLEVKRRLFSVSALDFEL